MFNKIIAVLRALFGKKTVNEILSDLERTIASLGTAEEKLHNERLANVAQIKALTEANQHKLAEQNRAGNVKARIEQLIK